MSQPFSQAGVPTSGSLPVSPPVNLATRPPQTGTSDPSRELIHNPESSRNPENPPSFDTLAFLRAQQQQYGAPIQREFGDRRVIQGRLQRGAPPAPLTMPSGGLLPQVNQPPFQSSFTLQPRRCLPLTLGQTLGTDDPVLNQLLFSPLPMAGTQHPGDAGMSLLNPQVDLQNVWAQQSSQAAQSQSQLGLLNLILNTSNQIAAPVRTGGFVPGGLATVVSQYPSAVANPLSGPVIAAQSALVESTLDYLQRQSSGLRAQLRQTSPEQRSRLFTEENRRIEEGLKKTPVLKGHRGASRFKVRKDLVSEVRDFGFLIFGQVAQCYQARNDWERLQTRR
jgi:hypothetical protein